MGTGSALGRLPWQFLSRVHATPLAPLLRAVFARVPRKPPWSRFVPSARSVAPLSIAVDWADRGASIRQAVSLLRKHGVVVLTGAVDAGRAEAARAEILAFLEPFIRAQRDDPGGGELNGCLWQTGFTRVTHLLHEGPVVTFADEEGGVDAGAVGLAKVDRVARDHRMAAVSDVLESPGHRAAREIVETIFRIRSSDHQAVVSDSVTRPREIHSDTLGEYYNVFTYLADVRAPDDGAYSYVPGSHLRRDILAKAFFLLRVRGSSPKEFPELRQRAVPLLAPKGSVIISSQRGVHGAHPQRQGGHRSVLVSHFF